MERYWRVAVTSVAILALLALVPVARAQGPGPRRGRGMGPGGMAGAPGVFLPLRAAQLTEAQRTQVRTLMTGYQKTWGPQLGPAMKALADAIKATPVDADAIRARSADLAAIQANAAVAGAQLRAQVLALLTPEQQQRVLQFESRMEQRRQQRTARHPSHRSGGRH
jgi:Spy/CpxP family protein refolding chaperone